MIEIFPTTISGTTGHSAKNHTQKITNKDNLKNSNNNLAFWGVKNPKYLGNTLRDWPDAVSSKEGSYYKPEKIIASNFVKPSNIKDNYQIKSLKLEYKYGKISYSSSSAHGKFGQPIICLYNGDNLIGKELGIPPLEDGTNNDGTNTNSKNLKNTSEVTFNLTQTLTAKDISNLKVSFENTSNTSNNHCRLVMQYLKLIIDVTEDTKSYYQTSVTYEGKKEKPVDKDVKVWVQVEQKNLAGEENCVCDITMPADCIISNISTKYGYYYDEENNKLPVINNYTIHNDLTTKTLTFNVSKLNHKIDDVDQNNEILKDNTAKIFFTITPTKAGIKKIKSTVREEFADDEHETDSRQFLAYVTTNKESLLINLLDEDNNSSSEFEITDTITVLATYYNSEGAFDKKINFAINENNPDIITNILISDSSNGFATENYETFNNGSSIPFKKNTVYFKAKITPKSSGRFKNVSIIKDNNYKKTASYSVLGEQYDRDNLLIRVEDGTSVEYDHIIFTKGDDLRLPLSFEEYQLEDNPIDDITIRGISKHIPLSQIQYVTFKITMDIDEDKIYTNLLLEPKVVCEGEDDSAIIIGPGPETDMLNNKYIILDSISTGEERTVKLAVYSNVEKIDYITLLLNGQTQRTMRYINGVKSKALPVNEIDETMLEEFSLPAKILFSDIPSIKLKINEQLNRHNFTSNPDDIETPSRFSLIYNVENVSNKNAEELNLKINEPPYFKVDKDGIQGANYNINKNIWTLKNLEPGQAKELLIPYAPTKKGVYNFEIETIDLPDIIDTPSTKTYNYTNEIEITQSISNNTPLKSDTIIYTLTVNVKDQHIDENTLIFNLNEISNTIEAHNEVHYKLLDYDITEGTFESNESTYDYDDKIGTWTLPIERNNTYTLKLQLLPTYSGEHNIQYTLNNKKQYMPIHVYKTRENNIDDVYKNKANYPVLIDIDSITEIQSWATKKSPYVNEYIDFIIKVDNRVKPKTNFIINISDIGNNNKQNSTNTYKVIDVDCEYGNFEEGTNNNIGTWSISTLGVNKEYYLTLTLKPTATGSHDILAETSDLSYSKTSIVNVLERKKKVSMNVYQGINVNKDDTDDCSVYDQICDDDFVSLGDRIGYVVNVSNNSKNNSDDIGKLFVDVILPPKLIDGLLTDTGFYGCPKIAIIDPETKQRISITEYLIDEDKNTLTFPIPFLEKCESIQFCFGLDCIYKGEFTTLFALYGDNIDVITKTLKITVNDVYPENKLEHYVNIYNFERLSQYFTYQINKDRTDLIKQYHKGDRSIRMIERTPYDVKSIESYKGSNLRELVHQLDKSRYVKPKYLRTGNNELDGSTYSLFPDGFIRRFGLLPSEVYHNIGVLPEKHDLIDDVIKWDRNDWDTKIWAGGIWDTGVFKVNIDYAKVPSNFENISIAELQSIINNTKPFGMRALASYKDTQYLNLGISIPKCTPHIISKPELKIPDLDIGLITYQYNPDETIKVTNSGNKINLNSPSILLNLIKYSNQTKDILYPKDSDTNVSITPNIDVNTYYLEKEDELYTIDQYDDILEANNLSKFDLKKEINTLNATKIENIQNHTLNFTNFTNDILSTESLNLEFTKDLTDNYQVLYTFKDDVINNSEVGVYLSDINNNILSICRFKDLTKGYNGFKLSYNDNIIRKINIPHSIESFKILVQRTNNNYLHFYYVLNDEIYAHHIGYYKDYQTLNYHTLYALKTKNLKTNKEYYTLKDIYILNNDSSIIFSLSNEPLIQNINTTKATQIESDLKWESLNNLLNKENTTVRYESDIDSDCEGLENNDRETSPIILNFDNINIDDYDIITDIGLQIKAQSNKKDFISSENINLSFLLDGNNYLNKQNASKIIYPKSLSSFNEVYHPQTTVTNQHLTICEDCGAYYQGIISICPNCESDNINYATNIYTTCHNCGLTSKGQYLKCPQCNSGDITYQLSHQSYTHCNNCNLLIEGTYYVCPNCDSTDLTRGRRHDSSTECESCGRISTGYYNRCPFCFSLNVFHHQGIQDNGFSYQLYSPEQEYTFYQTKYYTDQTKINICDIDVYLNKKSSIINQLENLELKITGNNNNNYEFYICEYCGFLGAGNFDVCPYCGNTNDDSDLHIHNYKHKLDIKAFVINHGVITQITDIQGVTISDAEFEIKADILEYAKKNNYDKFSIRIYVYNNYESLMTQIDSLDILEKTKEAIYNNIHFIDLDISDISIVGDYISSTEWTEIDNILNKKLSSSDYVVPDNMNHTDYIIIDEIDYSNISKINNYNIYIEGVNYDDHDIDIDIAVINPSKKEIVENPINEYANTVLKKTVPVFNVYNEMDCIKTGAFKYSFNISYEQIKELGDIRDCKIGIRFSNMSSNSKISVNNIHMQCFYDKKNYQIPQAKNTVFNVLQDDNTYYLTSPTIWDLPGQRQGQLNGYDINDLLLALSFGNLNYQEFIKLYNVTLIIKYINNEGTFFTKYFERKDDQESRIKIKAKVKNNGGLLFGSLCEDKSMLNNSSISQLDVDGEYLNYLELHDSIYQQFQPTNSTITAVELNILGRIGYPEKAIKLSLYKDKDNKPGNLIFQRTLDGWDNIGFTKFDFFVNNLDTSSKYWIAFELEEYDEYNYYKIGFNQSPLGQLIYKNKNTKIFNNLGLSCKIYEPISYYQYDKYETYTNGFYDFRIKQQLYRNNAESNIEISNFDIFRGKNYNEKYNLTLTVDDIYARRGDIVTINKTLTPNVDGEYVYKLNGVTLDSNIIDTSEFQQGEVRQITCIFTPNNNAYPVKISNAKLYITQPTMTTTKVTISGQGPDDVIYNIKNNQNNFIYNDTLYIKPQVFENDNELLKGHFNVTIYKNINNEQKIYYQNTCQTNETLIIKDTSFLELTSIDTEHVSQYYVSVHWISPNKLMYADSTIDEERIDVQRIPTRIHLTYPTKGRAFMKQSFVATLYDERNIQKRVSDQQLIVHMWPLYEYYIETNKNSNQYGQIQQRYLSDPINGHNNGDSSGIQYKVNAKTIRINDSNDIKDIIEDDEDRYDSNDEFYQNTEYNQYDQNTDGFYKFNSLLTANTWHCQCVFKGDNHYKPASTEVVFDIEKLDVTMQYLGDLKVSIYSQYLDNNLRHYLQTSENNINYIAKHKNIEDTPYINTDQPIVITYDNEHDRYIADLSNQVFEQNILVKLYLVSQNFKFGNNNTAYLEGLE